MATCKADKNSRFAKGKQKKGQRTTQGKLKESPLTIQQMADEYQADSGGSYIGMFEVGYMIWICPSHSPCNAL